MKVTSVNEERINGAIYLLFLFSQRRKQKVNG